MAMIAHHHQSLTLALSVYASQIASALFVFVVPAPGSQTRESVTKQISVQATGVICKCPGSKVKHLQDGRILLII